jgi:hypothetical protein
MKTSIILIVALVSLIGAVPVWGIWNLLAPISYLAVAAICGTVNLIWVGASALALKSAS